MRDIVNGLLVRDQKVLLAQRASHRSTHPNTWSFPGGHVEAGETLDEALVRELSEEIGVEATSWNFLSAVEDTESYPLKPARFHYIIVDDWFGEPKNLGNEHSQIRWVDLPKAAAMPKLTFSYYSVLFAALQSDKGSETTLL